MDLNALLSSFATEARYKRLTDRDWPQVIREHGKRSDRSRDGKLKFGTVTGTVVEVLRRSVGSMRFVEIHREVGALLGIPNVSRVGDSGCRLSRVGDAPWVRKRAMAAAIRSCGTQSFSHSDVARLVELPIMVPTPLKGGIPKRGLHRLGLMRLRVVVRLAVTVVVFGALVGFRSHGGAAGGWLFWTESPHGAADELGTIGRADLDGSRADERYLTKARSPAGIAISGPYVYWANYATGLIGRARIDGSGVDERFMKTGEVYSVIGVAVGGGHIYWTNSGLDPNSGTIGRADLNGRDIDHNFIRAGDSPIGVAVDGQHVYWTNRVFHETRSGAYFTYAIGRADLDGTHVDRRFIPISDVPDGVAVNDTYVFWSNAGEHVIGRANLDGSHVWQRCVGTQTQPLETVAEGLAADAQHVYWTTYPADTIVQANLNGTDAHRLISLRGVPGGIALNPEPESGISSNASACQSSTPPVLLGPTTIVGGPYEEGWGDVAPAVVSNGGAAASGTISDIHWSSWGGKIARGRGLNPTYTPHGGYYREPVIAELRASDVRRCVPGGRLVYTRFSVTEQIRPGGPMGKLFAWAPNLCVGI